MKCIVSSTQNPITMLRSPLILWLVITLLAISCQPNSETNTKSKDSTKSDSYSMDYKTLARSSTHYIVIIKNSNIISPLLTDTLLFNLDEKSIAEKRAASKKIVRDLIKKHKIKAKIADDQIYVDVTVAFEADLTDDEIESLLSDDDVESVEADVKIQGRPIHQGIPIPQGRPIHQDESWELNQNASGCWESCAVQKAGGPTDGSASLNAIWIVDTGIADGHPDLNIDNTLGRNFTVYPMSTNTDDDNGHGTLVAGIAGAKPIRWDTTLICGGVSQGARVVPIKVLDSEGAGYWSDIIDALDYIAQKGKRDDVINLSLGDYPIANCNTAIPDLRKILTRLGKKYFVVMAAGNDAGNAKESVPGCINGPRLFTIAAVNCSLQCALYSNYGHPVDFVAVGTDVFSTYLYDASSGKWTYMLVSGTSMATAVISGVIHATGQRPAKGQEIYCSDLGNPGNPLGYHLGTK